MRSAVAVAAAMIRATAGGAPGGDAGDAICAGAAAASHRPRREETPLGARALRAPKAASERQAPMERLRDRAR